MADTEPKPIQDVLDFVNREITAWNQLVYLKAVNDTLRLVTALTPLPPNDDGPA